MQAAVLELKAGPDLLGDTFKGALQLDFNFHEGMLADNQVHIIVYPDGGAGTRLTDDRYVDPDFGSSHTSLYVLIINTSFVGHADLTIDVRSSNPPGALNGTDSPNLEVCLFNQAPLVDAGSDQEITLPASANLDGTTADDGNPDPPSELTVAWTKISGPGTVAFSDPNIEDTSASFSMVGEYVLQLEADDGELTESDTVTIIVIEIVNDPPEVDAGTDQAINRSDVATLNGTVTDDGNPDPPSNVTTTWSKVSGSGDVTFADADAVDTTATFSAAGEYVLELTADDGVESSSDQVAITVVPVFTCPLELRASPSIFNCRSCRSTTRTSWSRPAGTTAGTR